MTTVVTLIHGDRRLVARITWPKGQYDERPLVEYEDATTGAPIDPRAVGDEGLQQLLTDDLHNAAFPAQAWGFSALTLEWNGLAWASRGGKRWLRDGGDGS